MSKLQRALKGLQIECVNNTCQTYGDLSPLQGDLPCWMLVTCGADNSMTCGRRRPGNPRSRRHRHRQNRFGVETLNVPGSVKVRIELACWYMHSIKSKE
jgi:hypothetical protein